MKIALAVFILAFIFLLILGLFAGPSGGGE